MFTKPFDCRPLAFVLSTKNLLANIWRQQARGSEGNLSIDTTYRVSVEGLWASSDRRHWPRTAMVSCCFWRCLKRECRVTRFHPSNDQGRHRALGAILCECWRLSLTKEIDTCSNKECCPTENWGGRFAKGGMVLLDALHAGSDKNHRSYRTHAILGWIKSPARCLFIASSARSVAAHLRRARKQFGFDPKSLTWLQSRLYLY